MSSRLLICFLAALVAIGPLSIDMYLASLPAISAELAAAPDTTHLTLSAFLLGFCLGMMIYGPLSDQLGRRRLIVFGLSLYVLTSAACATTQQIELLVALRFVQALGGGAAAVLGRAIVRDVFPVDSAARVLSLMQAVTMIAPLIAPLLGGYVAIWYGWRAVFWILTLFGALCLILVIRYLPETHQNAKLQSGVLRQATLGYRRILSDGRSSALLLGGGASFAGMFAYITSTPFLYIEYYGIESTQYGYYFAANIAGIAALALVNAAIVKRFGSELVLRTGAAIALAAALILLASTHLGEAPLPLVALLVFAYVSTVGLIGANCIGLLMQRHARDAGAATAAFGVTQFGLGALASTVSGFYLSPTGFAAILVCCAALSVSGLGVATRGQRLSPRSSDYPERARSQ